MIFIIAAISLCSDQANARDTRGDGEDAQKIATLLDSHSDIGRSGFPQIRRRQGKIDRVTAISLNAIEPLVELVHQEPAPENVGVFIGNMLGGWEFGERELKTLYSDGAERVSAFQATAWFPAAIQGEITIAHACKGYSKTMSGGLSSGLEAFMVAYDALSLGKINTALVGACEALTADFSVRGVSDFQSKIIGEAACFFLLSKIPFGDCIPLKFQWKHSPDNNYQAMFMDYAGRRHNLLDRVPFHLAAQPLIELSHIASTTKNSSQQETVDFTIGNATYCFEMNGS